MELAIWMDRGEVDAFCNAEAEDSRVVIVESRILELVCGVDWSSASGGLHKLH